MNVTDRFTYRIGDEVKIQLKSVSKELRKHINIKEGEVAIIIDYSPLPNGAYSTVLYGNGVEQRVTGGYKLNIYGTQRFFDQDFDEEYTNKPYDKAKEMFEAFLGQ